MVKRKQRMVERQLVHEYVLANFPDAIAKFFNLRMGRPPAEVLKKYPGADPKHFRVWQGYADVVIVLKDRIIILEGKVYHPRNAIAQLEEYYQNAGSTSELQPYLPRPIEKLLVTAIASPSTLELARTNNINVEVFRPTWLIPILQERNLM